MDTIRNVTQLLIGKAVAESTITDLVLVTSGSQFNDGEIFITDSLNRYLDGSTAALDGLIKYGQARGSEILWSDIIDLKNNLNGYALGTSAAETQQTDYVGFNGVSAGDITGVASNIYTIRLNILDKTTAGFMQQCIKEGFYKSNANASSYTQQAIAEGLVRSLIANYSRMTEQDLTFGAVNSGARLALATAAGTVTFTKGSKYALFNTDITDATTNAALAVGDLLAAAVGLTVFVYRVVSIDVGLNTAELDHAFQGATATVANNAVGRVLSATALAGDYGVKIQGVNREFKAGYYWSNVMFWVTQIDFTDLAGEVLVTSTAAYPGIGTGDYVANLEGELQADEFIYRGFPEAGVVNRTDAVAGNGAVYDVQVIEHEHDLKAAQGTPTESPKTLMVAWKTNATENAVELAIVAIQEALFTAANVTFSAQAGNITDNT
jgi:hypothetical protein